MNDVRWQVHPPPAGEPDWLVAVRRFRAEVLHADGLRPMFRRSDGQFRDDDPADPFAHHVVATDGGRPVAVFRVVPLGRTRRGVCERLIGSAPLGRLLTRIEADRADTWEGSGWAVHPERRRAALGVTALAAGQVVARRLGLRTAIGAAGSRYGQLYRILAAGYQPAPGIGSIYVPELVDDLQLVHGTLDTLRPGFQATVERAADLLRWQQGSPTRVNGRSS